MAKKKSVPQKGTIKLPDQVLDLGSIPKKNLYKIFFQFDVNIAFNGTKKFGLVAYPAYLSGKSLTLGEKIVMPIKKGKKNGKDRLKLPLTLGNLELRNEDLLKLLKTGNPFMTVSPFLYTKNAHAAYSITDEQTTTSVDANPTPPGNPE